ncbi:MAG: hypothetical protein AAFZ65_17910, partial [Planctomycetota bacterium]
MKNLILATLAILTSLATNAFAQDAEPEVEPLPWATLEQPWVMQHLTADQYSELNRGNNPVGPTYGLRLEMVERWAASAELKVLEGQPDDRVAEVRTWATSNLNQRVEYPSLNEQLEDLIVRSALLVAIDRRR